MRGAPGSQHDQGILLGSVSEAKRLVMVLADSRANFILVALGHQEGPYALCQAWIGMITFGTRRRLIGNLPKKPQMSPANKNSSTWRPYAGGCQ